MTDGGSVTNSGSISGVDAAVFFDSGGAGTFINTGYLSATRSGMYSKAAVARSTERNDFRRQLRNIHRQFFVTVGSQAHQR